MDRFVYLHGFNSGAASRSGRELSALLGVPVICPECEYSLPFQECLAGIRRQISESIDKANDRLTVMGSSLGGFYALQLRHPAIIHTVAWNPAIFPALQLEPFLGANTRFTDGVDWEFTREALLSYAEAPDPRPWQNSTWLMEQQAVKDTAAGSQPCFLFGGRSLTLLGQNKEGESLSEREARRTPRRDIFLAGHDELLDARLSRAFWQGSAALHEIDSGHQILDYGHAVELLKDGKLMETFGDWQSGTSGQAWDDSFREAGGFSMAGIFAPGEALETVRHYLWLGDASYLEMQGQKNGAAFPLTAVFFHPRHEERTRRLLTGLVKRCGSHRYVLLRADGKAARHQCAANRLQDSDYDIPLPEDRNFAAAIQAAFPGWKGESAQWHGHERHGSFFRAMMRARFAELLDEREDPVAAYEGK